MKPTHPRIALFGYVSPGQVFAVPQYPQPNTGAYVSHKHSFIGADCTMAARTLAKWGVPAQLIGNALGNDALGQATLAQLKRERVKTFVETRDDLRTPEEIDVIDQAGTRTFFVDNTSVWETLNNANLDPINTSALLYADWYAGDAVNKACARAQEFEVPIYLNVEYSLDTPTRYLDLIQKATYVQCPINDAVRDDAHAYNLARALRNAGANTVFVTRGKFGALALQGDTLIEQPTPEVRVVDAQGAGATFSAVALFGLTHGWQLARILQTAVRAASHKCTQFGLLNAPLESLNTTP